jgi:hypothetical protein
MISHKHNFIFVHLQKTGGTSIEAALLPYADDKQRVEDHQDGVETFELSVEGTKLKKHSLVRDYMEVLEPEFFNCAFKFAAVRNPWERMISIYYFNKFYLRKATLSEDEAISIKEEPLDEGLFLQYLESAKRLRRFVSPWVDGKAVGLKKHKMDFFLRNERLQADFDVVTAKIGIPQITLPRRNQSSHRQYAEYYTPALKQLVANRFADEIEMFGWKFGSA